ncbi:MAG TPA: alanine racemase [Anaerolineales bacterium]|nr:alanine racemase [Anaerolineales bacterium]
MRPTYLEVNLPQLQKNIESIRAHINSARLMAMVKANAYGHGLDGVGPFIEPYVDYFGVALLEEGIQLRELGVRKPILVAGGTIPEQIPAFIEHNLILTASSPHLLAAADAAAISAKKKLVVHLKIDTGMERVGVHYYDAEQFLEQSLKFKNIEIEGIYTHLANSEDPTLNHARQQLERFQNVLQFYEKRNVPTPLRHVANSGAILQFPESYLDMARPGLILYGVYPAGVPHTVDISPAIRWRSRVAYSKITRPGHPVSYGSLWQAETETRIATIPCGYADGYFRRMTNQAEVVINGKKYPQVGRICMDQFMVNVGDDVAEVGDEVTLLGDGITAYDLADWTGTNEYEVLTNISARVPRLYLKE